MPGVNESQPTNPRVMAFMAGLAFAARSHIEGHSWLTELMSWCMTREQYLKKVNDEKSEP